MDNLNREINIKLLIFFVFTINFALVFIYTISAETGDIIDIAGINADEITSFKTVQSPAGGQQYSEVFVTNNRSEVQKFLELLSSVDVRLVASKVKDSAIHDADFKISYYCTNNKELGYLICSEEHIYYKNGKYKIVSGNLSFYLSKIRTYCEDPNPRNRIV